MKVLYLVSIDCAIPGETGGVLRLMRSYADLASRAGISISFFDMWHNPDLSSFDLAHMAPGDLATLGVARHIKRRNLPFVVSPIIDKTFPNWAIRLVSWGDRLAGRLYRSHVGGVREICELSSGVCALSKFEARRVEKGLGVRSTLIRPVAPYVLQNNGTVDESQFRRLYPDEDFVLFVGDVSNGRKNVLRLIEATSQLGLPLVLVGTLHSTTYGEKVRQKIRESKKVTYLGVLPQPVLLGAMKSSRVFALPSLTEGVGFAAVEAASLGANVVVTQHGGPTEYLGDQAWYVNPNSMTSLCVALRQAWDAPKNPCRASLLAERFSEEVQARALADFYAEVVH